MATRHIQRAPVMVPGHWAGIDLPDARATRVEAGEDKSITVTTLKGQHVVAGPGETTRLVIVTEAQRPRWARLRSFGPPRPSEYLMVLAGREVRLFVRLQDFTATRERSSRQRDTSGAESVAQALGLPLEGATPEDLALLATPEARRAALLFPLSGGNQPQWATAVTLAGIVVAFLSWTRGYGWDTAAVSVVAALIVAPVLVRVHRLRGLFRRVADTLPDGAGDGAEFSNSTIVAPTGSSQRGMARSRLLLGPDRVVLHTRGGEHAVAGPRLGGATRCIVEQAIVFTSETKVPLLSLGRPLWCPTPAAAQDFAQACKRAGIACDVLPEMDDMPETMDEGSPQRFVRNTLGLVGGPIPYPYQIGSVQMGVPWFLMMATGMLTGTGLANSVVASLDAQPLSEYWWGIPFTLIVGTAFVVTVADSLRYSHWERSQRKKVRDVPA